MRLRATPREIATTLRHARPLGPRGRRQVRSRDQVVLTYDDGPDPGVTESVLAALDGHDATATFFVLVNRAKRTPSLVHEILAAGHEVGLHGPDHRPLTDFSPAQVLTRTEAARHELEELVGAPVRWFRPPYGTQTRAIERQVRRAGLTTVLWSSDWRDWEDVSHEDRLAAARHELRPGRIVLAHDGFADAFDGVDDGPRPDFDRARLSREVLDIYADRGLRAVSLRDHERAGTAADPGS